MSHRPGPSGSLLEAKPSSARKRSRILVMGGAPRSLTNFRGPLLQAMVDLGHEVIACAPGADRSVERSLRELGVTYRHVPIERAGINPIADLRTLVATTRLLRDLQPDVFLGYTIKPVIYGMVAAQWAGVPSRYGMITGLGYAFGNGGVWRRGINLLVRGLYKVSFRGARAIMFQNPDDIALFEHLNLVTPDRAVLLNGSGVDLDHFAPQPVPGGSPSFLLIARLIAEKGILEYVEAAREVKRLHPGVVFRLVGHFDSNPTAISLDLVRTWEADGLIEFLGQLEDVRPAIADSSVYVLPSYYREGTPRSVLEAMAMGRPVITTDAPGCRETVVEGRNGFLVPPRDPDALAQAMLRFVERPEIAADMGSKSLQIARQRYDVHKVNDVMLRAMGLRS